MTDDDLITVTATRAQWTAIVELFRSGQAEWCTSQENWDLADSEIQPVVEALVTSEPT